MLLLGIDTTTLSCSIAVGEEGQLYGEYTLNIKKTHSQRLMPLIVSLLKDTGLQGYDLQGVVVSKGPGSFTGTRIGVATARGLCQGLDIPAAGVTSLEVLAAPFTTRTGLICPLLDARRQQVYTALYRAREGKLEEEFSPAALHLDKLLDVLLPYQEEILFTGEGIFSYSSLLQSKMGSFFQKAPPELALNRGSFLLQIGFQAFKMGRQGSFHKLEPYYLRLPEAERRWQEQKKKGE